MQLTFTPLNLIAAPVSLARLQLQYENVDLVTSNSSTHPQASLLDSLAKTEVGEEFRFWNIVLEVWCVGILSSVYIILYWRVLLGFLGNQERIFTSV